jgi:hypothetical protein
MAVLGRRLQLELRMSHTTGWATFGRNCDTWEHWKMQSSRGSREKPDEKPSLVV